MAAVLIVSGILLSLGELYEPIVFGSHYKLKLDNRAITFILFGTAGLIGAYATGMLGYMGGVAGGTGGGVASISASLIGWLVPTLFAITTVAFLDWPKGGVKWLLGGFLFLQFILLVPTGRRNLLYCVLLGAIATRFTAFRPKWSTARKLLYAGLLAVFVAVGAVSFFYLRVAGYKTHRKLTLPERIELVSELVQNGGAEKANKSFAENLQTRTFVLGFFSDLLAASQKMPTAMGWDAYHEFQLVIPSAFWADKTAFLYQEETIANMQFHFAFTDQPNSILTAGALDFGFWGAILYPIMLCVLYRTMAEIFRIHLPRMASTFVILTLLFASLMTEAALNNHLGTIRNTFVFSSILWFFSKLPSFGLRHRYAVRGSAQ
jgi:hypothetical protein